MALTGGNIGFTGYQQPNYAGVVEAAGLPMQAVGQGIAQAQDYFKQQGEKKKLIKQSDIQIDAALKLFPDLAPTLQGVRDQIKDENISLNERADIAETVAGLINMGTKQMQAKRQLDIEEEKAIQSALIRRAELKDSKWQPYVQEIEIDGKKVKVIGSVDQFGQFKDIENNIYPSVAGAFSPAGQSEPPLPDGAYPDGVPTVGTPMDSPGVLPLDKQNKVPEPPISFDFNQFPSVPGDPAIAPATMANIEAAGAQPATQASKQLRLPAGSSLVTDKSKVTYRPFTPDEIARYGSDGQVGSDGKVYPIRPPSGTEFTINPDKSVTYKTGAGVGAAKAEAKAEAAKKAEENKIDKAIALTQDLNLLEDRMKSMAPGVVGAAGRIVAEQIPGTFQAENKEVIDRVIATLTLENLQAMRNNSPTGAALGNVSDKDTGLMRDSATSLRNAQTPEAFKRELVRLKNLQHDVVYGSERVLKDKLSKGKIDKSQFDAAMAAAPSEYLNDRGVITTRPAIPAVSGSRAGLDQGAQDVLKEFLPK